jgi:hypothetical protein
VRTILAIGAAVLLAGPVQALSLAECTRTTHVSHGGEAEHKDLGAGRVIWQDWWSLEGTAMTLRVVDCGPGRALSARVAEENMNRRAPLDKTEEALAVIAGHEAGARVFATLERMADDLRGFARDVMIEDVAAESCACAALYPELRGDKTAFGL